MCYFKTAARSGTAIGIYNPRNKIHINKHAHLQLQELFLSLCSYWPADNNWTHVSVQTWQRRVYGAVVSQAGLQVSL